MKKILFPTDFSAAAHNAFQYTIELAKITNAKVDVISVYPGPIGEELYTAPEDLRPIHKEKQKKMEEKMSVFLSQYDYKNIGTKIVYPSDFIANSIVSRSKRGYDLIVMGTKGERNAMDKIIGSVTTGTMTNAACPVLAIPEDAKFNGIEQITYATSFSTNDNHFIQQLSGFAKTVGAIIQFLHVSTKSKINTDEELMREKSSNEFSQFHIVNNPSVMEGVDDFLREKSSDVLALFIPKRSLWDTLFHRSFSKKMTFHATIPLLVFHE